jgi:hypothetical protein
MAGCEAADEGHYREMQRRADRICSLIVASDYPAVDVAIEVRKLRAFAEQHFPGRVELFEKVYESRFNRLWEQFRSCSQERAPAW